MKDNANKLNDSFMTNTYQPVVLAIQAFGKILMYASPVVKY